MDTIRPFAQGSSPLPEFDQPGVFTSTGPSGEPIRVARKIRGKKRPNVFLGDRGFPDQSHEFDVILHNVEGGPILRKRKHAAPPLDDIDPRFLSQYDGKIHGKKLRKEIDLSHLDGTTRDLVYKLLQKYWSVFDDKGQFVPVKDYKCSIDTGSARPICVKNINYGPREIPIMTWKDLARSLGITIDEGTNTNIIVDDILSWAKSLLITLIYMECQLKVCQSQNLSLSL